MVQISQLKRGIRSTRTHGLFVRQQTRHDGSQQVSPCGTRALESHTLQTSESPPVHKQQLVAKDRLLGP